MPRMSKRDKQAKAAVVALVHVWAMELITDKSKNGKAAFSLFMTWCADPANQDVIKRTLKEKTDGAVLTITGTANLEKG